MAINCKTMKPLDSSVLPDGRIQHVYGCGVCHGVLIEYEPEGDDCRPEGASASLIAESPCPLCNDGEPESRRYLMALHTVAWNCGLSERHEKTAPHGFPSFLSVGAEPDIKGPYVCLRFMQGECEIYAYPEGVQIPFIQESRKGWVVLDGRRESYGRKRLALEVVSRVRHDLELNHKEFSE